MRFPRIAFVTAVLVAVASRVCAQSPNATINGLVLDPSNSAITGAEVLVINDATGLKYFSKTNREGVYVVPNLPPGPYRLQISKVGFKTIVKPDIVLNVQDALSINFTLPIGAALETVTVEGGAPLVNTESGAVSVVVDRKYVENMPLNGRSFQDLVLLTPGVVTNSPQEGGAAIGNRGEFSVNGQRTESNYYTVDGVSANTGVSAVAPFGPGNNGSVPAATALGTTQSIVSVDALQEFRIQSSTYSAEYGRNPGGQFSFVTRSGTNQWHGTAFDYLRNNLFDANNWFNDYLRQPEPALRQNDFGGTLGGPLLVPKLYSGKDKTFFFFSYEGLRLTQPQASAISYVPDTALRQATPEPLQQVFNAFPVPNGPEVLDQAGASIGLGTFTGSWSNPNSLNAYSIRLDQTFNDKLRLFFRFADTNSSAATRNPGPSIQSNPSMVQTSRYTSQAYTFGAISALSNRLSNDFRLNYTSNTSNLDDRIDSFGGALPINLAQVQQIGPSSNRYFVLAGLEFGSFATGLLQQSQIGQQRAWNTTDSTTFAFGRQQLKFGIDYRRLAPVEGRGSPGVIYLFLDQNEAISNQAGVIFGDNDATFYPLYTNFSAFVQDDWKLTKRLNLSIGTRWEVNPPPGVTQGPLPLTVEGINNLQSLSLAPAGTRAWKVGWYNFAPRLGAAYVLRNAVNSETVLRGGAGVFFDTGQQPSANVFFSPNYMASNTFGSLFNNPRSFPLAPAEAQPVISQQPTPPYGAIYGFPPHLQLPYTTQWNLSLDQAFGNSQALSITGVGAHASRLLEERQINISSFNPNFTNLVLYQSGGTSDYDALQIKFQRKISHGLTALASYTYGHSLDYGSSDFNFPYQRGNSDFDVRHNFSSAFSYDLPGAQNRFGRAILGNWGIDDRFTARTGFPVTLDGNALPDPATGTFMNAGLDLLPGTPLYVYGSQCATVYENGLSCPGGRAINPHAFASPPIDPNTGNPLRLGNAPRNFVRGFGMWQMDVAIRREFHITDALKLTFRAEAFNVFNHPIFGTIDENFCDPGPGTQCTFGQSTATLNSSLGVLSPLYQAGGPRSMQFALKLGF